MGESVFFDCAAADKIGIDMTDKVFQIDVDQRSLWACNTLNANGGIANPTGPIVWSVQPKDFLAIEVQGEGRNVIVIGAEPGECVVTATVPTPTGNLTPTQAVKVNAAAVTQAFIETTPPF